MFLRKKSNQKYGALGVFLTLSVVVSIVIANRWFATSLGLESFGRVWFLYVNYWEFGFIKRGFEGSILNAVGISKMFENPYHLGFFWHSVKLVVLGLLAYQLLRRVSASWIFAFGLVFSPVFILHYGYETGSSDITLVILTIVLLVHRLPDFLFVIGLCVGLLVHEVYIFFVPSMLLLHVHRKIDYQTDFYSLSKMIVKLSLLPVLVFVGLLLGSRSAPNQAQYEQLISGHLGVAVGKHPFWSGYFELYKSAQENILASQGFVGGGGVVYAATPLIYLAALLILVFFLYRKNSKLFAAVLVVALALPLLATYFATDLYRYISYAGTLALVAIALAPRDQIVRLTSTPLVPGILLVFTLSGPLGNFPISDPYPVMRFALNFLKQI